MKTKSFLLLCGALGAALAVASLPAAEKSTPAPTAPTAPTATKKTMRVISVSHDDASAESAGAPQAFLGVETSRVDPALAAQLGLTRGLGLVVNTVIKDAAAAGVLERFDLLTKFEDQLLVSADQLGVLIRTNQPGDEVKLTYLRAGKEATAFVTLGKRPAPVRRLGAKPELHERLRELHGSLPSEVREHLRRIDPAAEGQHDFIWHAAEGAGDAPRAAAVLSRTGTANLVFTNEGGTVEITSVDGKRVAKVSDADGKVLFDGPLESNADREALPAAVQDRLRVLDEVETLEFAPAPDDVEVDVRVSTPTAAAPGAKPASGPVI